MAANAEFRAAWLAMVPNIRLVRAVRLYDDHVDSLRFLTLSEGRIRAVVIAGITALADAIQAHDGPKAATSMLAHLEQAEEALRKAAISRREAS
jgi:DNA-binding GntR family transcriptional regulator